MKQLLKRYPFFLFLLPLFVIIHFEKEFHGVIKYEFIYDRIIILFAIPLLVFLLFYMLFRSVTKSSLMTFGFLLFFYYTGDLRNWLSELLPGSIWQRYTFLLPVLLAVLIVLFLRLRKTSAGLQRTFFFINTALLLFIAIDTAGIFLTGSRDKNKASRELSIENTACDSCTRPDIYYIIFDAYTSSQQLLSEFGYSNDRIEEELVRKGFRIVRDSKSNYNYTAFSLASVFNMNYLKDIGPVHKIQSRLYFRSLKLVYHNTIFPFFGNENYRVFNHSFMDIRSYPATIRHADVWDVKKLFDQYNLVFKLHRDLNSYLPAGIRDLFKTRDLWSNPEERNQIDSAIYEKLMHTAQLKINQPKFIYAHFMRPHPNYYFDSLGRRFSRDTISNREAYIHQIAYSNNMIKKITDSIMTLTGRPLVIIIQGDHGDKNTETKERAFTNFNALYFSNGDYRFVNDSITNVNTFRIILNSFFNKNLALLPGRFYLMYE